MILVVVALAASLIAGFVAWRIAFRSVGRIERTLAADRARFEALAHDDPLTGLPNKRAFDDRLDGELRRAAREYYPVAVVVLELDRFEQIGAAGGQAAGEEALKELARHFQELRAGDMAGRVGGHEFVLSLVRADARSAERVLARLRKAVESAEAGPSGERLGFSAGIAEYPRHGSNRAQLVERAGDALSRGKAQGPGRTTVYSPEASGHAAPPAPDARAMGPDGLLSTLEGMAEAVDSKNRFTKGHSERVAAYAVAIASSFEFPEDRLAALRRAALLHDVGKIGIRESILAKETPLSLDEAEELQRHSELGRAMLAGAGLHEPARWVNHLHERFDGAGYPFGLAGRAIPVESRILHVADALDHMARDSAARRYRPLREALAELSYSSGTRLDPEITTRAIELVDAGELELVGHEKRPVARLALGRPHARPVS